MTVSEIEWNDREPERRAASEGDPLAWESLFTWLWVWTIHLARSEDGAMRGWEKIILRPSLWLKKLGYFAQIFRNAGRDEDRAQRRQAARVDALLASLRAQPPTAFDGDRSAMLREAVAQLSSEHQTLLELYLEGRSLEEIAEDSGTAYGTLRRRINTAVKALRKILGARDGGEGLTPAHSRTI